MTPQEALNKLKTLSNSLDTVPYEEIIDLIQTSIKTVPIPLAKLRKNAIIDRARKNIGNNLFKKVSEINYITDQNIINQYLTEFGRANKPHSPVFYGAIESTLINTQRVTALYEVSNLLQDKSSINTTGELYTVSRWHNTKELILAEIVFSKEAINTNPDVKKSFQYQVDKAEASGVNDLGFFVEMLIFFSEEFARQKVTHNDYKISTAYANIVLTHPDVQGIAYPSVATGLYGQNVMFPPEIVDQYIKIDKLITQRIHKNKEKVLINNHMYCNNPNHDPDNLTWEQHNPEDIVPPDEILAHLKA